MIINNSMVIFSGRSRQNMVHHVSHIKENLSMSAKRKKDRIFTMECILRKIGPFSNAHFKQKLTNKWPCVAYHKQSPGFFYNMQKIASRYHQHYAHRKSKTSHKKTPCIMYCQFSLSSRRAARVKSETGVSIQWYRMTSLQSKYWYLNIGGEWHWYSSLQDK